MSKLTSLNPYHQTDLSDLLDSITFTDKEIALTHEASTQDYIQNLLGTVKNLKPEEDAMHLTKEEQELVKKLFFGHYTVEDLFLSEEKTKYTPYEETKGVEEVEETEIEFYTDYKINHEFASRNTLTGIRGEIERQKERAYRAHAIGAYISPFNVKERVKDLEHVTVDAEEEEEDFFI